MRRNWTWRKPLTWPLTRRAVVAMVVVTYAGLAYGLTHTSDPAAATEPAPPTVVNYYETACQNQARVSRGIPPLTMDQSRGLIAWERGHAGTAEAADYHAALDVCQATQPAGKFNWGGMVLAYQEFVGD